MIVLALDTSTPTVTAGVVEVTPFHEVMKAQPTAGHIPLESLAELRAERTITDPFAHAERLMPLAQEALTAAGQRMSELDAVVVGLGPGPFTGLRVGIATAAAVGDALDLPVHGVPSHDGTATTVGPVAGSFLVVTDARRREVYLSAYQASGRRVFGPLVLAPAAVPALLAEHALEPVALAGAGAELLAGALDLPVLAPAGAPAWGLVVRALPALLTGAVPGPLTPLYLRRPDATEPKPRVPATLQYRSGGQR